jgi:hypothetical protein
VATASAWAPNGPARFGLNPNGPASNTPTELTAVATPSAGAANAAKLYSPENPLFWFGVIGAATFGLMAFSTSVRVGHATAAVSLGSTK